jgi:hypothetical protein
MIAIPPIRRIRDTIVEWVGGVCKESSTTVEYTPIFVVARKRGWDYSDSTDDGTVYTDTRTGERLEVFEATSNAPAEEEAPARPSIVSKLHVRRGRPRRERQQHQRQARAPTHVPSRWLVRKHTR